MERIQLQDNKRDLAVLVGLRSPVLREDSTDEESLEELSALVETAGGQVVGSILQSRDKPDPHSFIGEGKVEEVKTMVTLEGATLVIFDNELSPSQIRVLTELLGVQVIDRSGLILDIFAQRAKTKEGCLQVELAQYQYLLPRLIGMWTHLERQAGTSGKGPIGSKGPGETQLETDRRHIHRKIDKLKEELEEVRRVRGTQRQRRMKNEIPVVAIVGYTNAGKIHPSKRHHRRGHPRQQPSFRHPGYHHPAAHRQRYAGCGDLRHRGLYPQAAPPAGGGLQGHSGGAGVRGPSAPRHRRSPTPSGPQQAQVVDSLIRELKADHIPCLRVYNKCDLAFPGAPAPGGGQRVYLRQDRRGH